MKALGRLFDIVPCIIPVDLETAANDGDWICMENWNTATIVFFKAAGVANDDPTITIEQGTSSAGAGAKALNAFTSIYTKQGALLTAVGTWTENTQAADEQYAFNATSAEQQLLAVLEFDADQMDVDGGFCWFRARVADPGAAGTQLGCALAILSGPRYAAAPENLPNVIA